MKRWWCVNTNFSPSSSAFSLSDRALFEVMCLCFSVMMTPLFLNTQHPTSMTINVATKTKITTMTTSPTLVDDLCIARTSASEAGANSNWPIHIIPLNPLHGYILILTVQTVYWTCPNGSHNVRAKRLVKVERIVNKQLSYQCNPIGMMWK